MSRGPDIGTLLIRALYRDAMGADCALELVESDWVRWASATFVGAQHTMRWNALPSAALDRWLAGLPEADFALRGHLLAGITVTSVKRSAEGVTIELEALTLKD